MYVYAGIVKLYKSIVSPYIVGYRERKCEKQTIPYPVTDEFAKGSPSPIDGSKSLN